MQYLKGSIYTASFAVIEIVNMSEKNNSKVLSLLYM